MHDGGFWSGWNHWVPGLGHGLYGLLVWVLLIGAVVVLIRALVNKKD